MKSVSVEDMRTLDQRTIHEMDVSGRELMKRAGLGVAVEVEAFVERLPLRHRSRIVILCGKGNNGGDGYVIAHALSKKYNVIVYSVCGVHDLNGDARYYADVLLDAGVVLISVKQELVSSDFKQGDVVVDALLGTGSHGALRSPYDQWVSLLNSAQLPVVAVDIPSGLNGDTGTMTPWAVVADLTVTIGFPKKGMFLNDGIETCGSLRCVDIGIPTEFLYQLDGAEEVVMSSDIKPMLQRLPRNSHKGTNGRVVVIGGSALYKGAPLLAAEAALKAGAGLSVACVPVSSCIANQSCCSLILKEVADSGSGTFSVESLVDLKQAVLNAEALVVGPGITTNKQLLPVIEYLCSIGGPVVLDADALNIIAGNPQLYKTKLAAVLTPHPGEMSRLLKGFELGSLLESSRVEQALALSKKTEAVVVLKGHRTVVASPDGQYSLNTSGTAALATAGSGDVLTGVIASFLASGLSLFQAAQAACFVHGMGSELSCGAERGFTADELVSLIPYAIKYVSPVA